MSIQVCIYIKYDIFHVSHDTKTTTVAPKSNIKTSSMMDRIPFGTFPGISKGNPDNIPAFVFSRGLVRG